MRSLRSLRPRYQQPGPTDSLPGTTDGLPHLRVGLFSALIQRCIYLDNSIRNGFFIGATVTLTAYALLPGYRQFVIESWSNPWVIVGLPIGIALAYIFD